MKMENDATGPTTDETVKGDNTGCLFVLLFLIAPFVVGILYSIFR